MNARRGWQPLHAVAAQSGWWASRTVHSVAQAVVSNAILQSEGSAIWQGFRDTVGMSEDDAGDPDGDDAEAENGKWLATLKSLQPWYDQVRVDLQRASDGLKTRATLLVSASAVSFGVLTQGVSNEWGLLSLLLAVAAGTSGVIPLWVSERENYKLASIRKNLKGKWEGGHLPSETQLLESYYQSEERFNRDEMTSLKRSGRWIKAGFVMLVLSSALGLFSLIVQGMRGGELSGF